MKYLNPFLSKRTLLDAANLSMFKFYVVVFYVDEVFVLGL